jgi:microcystin synthetase protein McyJ
MANSARRVVLRRCSGSARGPCYKGAMFQNLIRGFEQALLTPKFLIKPNPEQYYEFLGDDVIEGRHEAFSDPNKPLWLNLGYWKTARAYPDAARALAERLGEAAQLGPGDAVLDVGFGFAEQDLFWLEHFKVAHITGVNITAMQVERSAARVAQRGLQAQIDLRVGSATELAFEDASFDKVTALECAHHFDTRQRFFEEAFRVLRPGGKLATADGISAAGDPPLNLLRKLALKRWCVPLTNVYDSAEYCQRLRDIGFVNVQAESIRNYVFPGCIKYQRLRNQGVSLYEARIELSQREIDECYGLDMFKLTGLTDYVIVSAEKPRHS